MHRFPFAALAALACGCSCARNVPEPPPPVDVAPFTLVRLYRDAPALAFDTYTGTRIRCRLAPGDYRVTADGVGWPVPGWFTTFPDAPPAVLFSCPPPPDDKQPLEIIGVCRGRVEDGRRRGPGVDWHVRVEGCQVSRRP